MELNREQIIKALTMFIEDMPADLHLGFSRTVLFRELLKDTLALIHELTEENERLEDNLIKQSTENIMLLRDKQDIQADTVRKMQERLKEKRIKPEFPWDDFFITETDIDQIAKELLEEQE